MTVYTIKAERNTGTITGVQVGLVVLSPDLDESKEPFEVAGHDGKRDLEAFAPETEITLYAASLARVAVNVRDDERASDVDAVIINQALRDLRRATHMIKNVIARRAGQEG